MTTRTGTKGRLKRFREGFFLIFQALGLFVRRPEWWKYVVLPVLVSVVLFVAAASGAMALADDAVARLWEPPASGWLRAAWHVTVFLTRVLLLGITLFVTVFLASIMAAPFNDMLTEAVEGEVGIRADLPFNWRDFLGDIGLAVAHTLLHLASYLVLSVFVLLLNLVPLLGSVASLCAGLFVTATVLSREFVDPALSRRRWTFSEKNRFYRENRPMMLGLGAGLAALFWVPLFNFFLIPIAAMAGTLAFARIAREGRSEIPDHRHPPEGAPAAPRGEPTPD